MPVKFWQMILRFGFLVYLITTVKGNYIIQTSFLSKIQVDSRPHGPLISFNQPTTLAQDLLNALNWPQVNFLPMSPKLVRTQPHTVENRGITMAPLFLRLISWKSLTQSIKIFVKLDFFTNVLVVCFVFVYIATLLRASADYTRKEVSFWFWQWQRCEF